MSAAPSTSARMTPIDTSKVTGRRELRFERIDDILADAERLAQSGYEQLGNWSLGRICRHLATTMRMGLDGAGRLQPWLVRVLARQLYFSRVLKHGMKAGFKVPARLIAVIAPEASDDEQGLTELRQVLERWSREPQRHPHAFFGTLSPQEWDTLSLRHAEMHLSFLRPR